MRIACSALLLVVLLAACGETTPAPGGVTVVSAVEKFSKQRAMDHVRKLAGDIGVRVRGTRGERLGARYIAKRFKSLGYKVNVQKFAVDNGTSRNVVAWWPTAKRFPFVIGAHMDTVSGAPGANDNASGVATILEVARLFADTRQAQWVRFVAFGSEEFVNSGVHHLGSTTYVRRLGPPGRKRLAGMLSVDMIADGVPLRIGHIGISEPVVARSVYRKVTKGGIATSWFRSCDCSDHGPFEHAGIPASFMWSGDEPNYHSSSDTPRNMDPDDLARTGRAVRLFVKQLDRRILEYYRRKG